MILPTLYSFVFTHAPTPKFSFVGIVLLSFGILLLPSGPRAGLDTTLFHPLPVHGNGDLWLSVSPGVFHGILGTTSLFLLEF